MFSILRFILIVGVIFYYSPVRDHGESPDPTLDSAAPGHTEHAGPVAPPLPSDGAPGHLEAVWQALPDSAKQAVVEKILAASGLTSAAPKPSDTLRPEDRAPSPHEPRG
ncbi:hypothetical protein [Microvirga makkahensis]|uniref:Uncharacterized protein n=1 Tax=Microvirga makkahensis TaxID=1128670 RepID=A0A7X3MWV8_9HYPH|nr:hypothetical protein [Microvirga makkahensis]MXQ14490.1 hypothetical protein [Microvirga makkahensis]